MGNQHSFIQNTLEDENEKLLESKEKLIDKKTMTNFIKNVAKQNQFHTYYKIKDNSHNKNIKNIDVNMDMSFDITINNKKLDTPPTLNNININYFINNKEKLEDIYTTIKLNGKLNEPVIIPKFPKNYGVYIIYVHSIEPNGPSGTYIIRKNNLIYGSVIEITTTKGVNDELLTIEWPIGKTPMLLYKKTNINSNLDAHEYKIKIISI